MSYNDDLSANVRRLIRNIPDFPKPGIQFKDISPLLRDPGMLDEVCLWMGQGSKGATGFVGLDARGFIFGSGAALNLGLPLIMCRKAGKLPGECVSVSYDLEYGSATVEMQTDSVAEGDTLIIADDLLATGGSAMAAVNLIRKMGGTVRECVFVIELAGLGGRERLEEAGVKVRSLITYGD